MHHTYVRNLFNLHWQKIIIAFFLLASYSLEHAHGQGLGYKRRHLEHYDDKVLHYGFNFSLPMSRYRFVHSDEYSQPDVPYRIESPSITGFRMGLSANLGLTNHFDLRFTPAVSLYSRELHNSYAGTEEIQKLRRESTWIELPLLLKYKSKRRVNSRMYMIAGATLGFETNVRRKNVGVNNELHAKGSDFTIDYGFGFERFFEFFKLAPELRFSHGLVNLLPEQATNTGLQRMTSHSVTLYLNFE